MPMRIMMIRHLKRHKLRVLTIALLICMLAGSLLGVFSPTQRYGTDKILHLLGYFSLSFLTMLTFKATTWRQQLVVALCVFFFGMAMEIAQYFIPHRRASLADLAFNTLGIMLGWLAIRFVVYWQKRR